MEKNPGGQKFWQRGEGRFREILSCPPPKCALLLKCPPPQIPRPGAATAKNSSAYDIFGNQILSGIQLPP